MGGRETRGGGKDLFFFGQNFLLIRPCWGVFSLRDKGGGLGGGNPPLFSGNTGNKPFGKKRDIFLFHGGFFKRQKVVFNFFLLGPGG